MSSILTNNSAMVALQTLTSVNKNLSQTQNEISTGLKVSNAKDNAAVWAVSQTMQSDVKSFEALSDSLSLGSSTIAVARNATESLVELGQEIKAKAISALEDNVDRTKIQNDIVQLRSQMDSIVSAAQFNGKNLIANGGTDMEVTTSFNRTSATAGDVAAITVTAVDLSSTALTNIAGLDVSTFTGAATDDATIDTIETEINTMINAAASFGSAEKRIDIQSDFVSKLTDNFKSGIGAMVDADMEQASARLQSLQVQQQLSTQALSIANQAPQSILSLFR